MLSAHDQVLHSFLFVKVLVNLYHAGDVVLVNVHAVFHLVEILDLGLDALKRYQFTCQGAHFNTLLSQSIQPLGVFYEFFLSGVASHRFPYVFLFLRELDYWEIESQVRTVIFVVVDLMLLGHRNYRHHCKVLKLTKVLTWLRI